MVYEFDGTEYDELRDMQAARRAKYLDLVRGDMNFIQSSRMDRPKTRPIAPCPNLDGPITAADMHHAGSGTGRASTYSPERRGAGHGTCFRPMPIPSEAGLGFRNRDAITSVSNVIFYGMLSVCSL
ncbi:hypothetical protein [Pseudoscardovia radai]|uniref:hypothetical protein n=1 Tax=Pseudoscardovia radai TaxID=987066 RepID=UPI00399673D3